MVELRGGRSKVGRSGVQRCMSKSPTKHWNTSTQGPSHEVDQKGVWRGSKVGPEGGPKPPKGGPRVVQRVSEQVQGRSSKVQGRGGGPKRSLWGSSSSSSTLKSTLFKQVGTATAPEFKKDQKVNQKCKGVSPNRHQRAPQRHLSKSTEQKK